MANELDIISILKTIHKLKAGLAAVIENIDYKRSNLGIQGSYDGANAIVT